MEPLVLPSSPEFGLPAAAQVQRLRERITECVKDEARDLKGVEQPVGTRSSRCAKEWRFGVPERSDRADQTGGRCKLLVKVESTPSTPWGGFYPVHPRQTTSKEPGFLRYRSVARTGTTGTPSELSWELPGCPGLHTKVRRVFCCYRGVNVNMPVPLVRFGRTVGHPLLRPLTV